MRPTEAKPRAIFRALTGRIAAAGARAEQDEPLAGARFPSLTATFPHPARRDRSIEFDFSFVPDIVGSGSRYLSLQSFVQVGGDASIERCPDLLWMLAKLNCYLPIGFFGVFESLELLYWKSTSCLDGDTPPGINAELILEQARLARNVIADFEDSLLDVVEGRSSAIDALRANKWAAVVLGR